MKRGLRDLTLHAMLAALARDHAFAEEHLCPLHGAFLYEVVVLHHQDFSDVVGMIQEDDVLASDLVMSDVPILLGQVLEENDRICRTKFAKCVPEEISLKPGREVIHGATGRRRSSVVSGRGRHLISLFPTADLQTRQWKYSLCLHSSSEEITGNFAWLSNLLNRLSALESIEFRQHFRAVFERIDASIGLGDLAVGINQERVARRKFDEAEVGQRSIGVAYVMAGVGEQFEIQTFLRAELFMRIHAVDAHA